MEWVASIAAKRLKPALLELWVGQFTVLVDVLCFQAVSVCLGCSNKILQTEWLINIDIYFSQF